MSLTNPSLLTDDELVDAVASLADTSRESTALLVAHLVELNRRGLHHAHEAEMYFTPIVEARRLGSSEGIDRAAGRRTQRRSNTAEERRYATAMRILMAVAISTLVAGAVGPAAGEEPASGTTKPATVVFVCEHGTVKSVIAAELFNRRAAERKLRFHAVARGVTPEERIPDAVAGNLKADGFDLSGFAASPLTSEDAKTAAYVVAIGVDPPLLKDAKAMARWTDVPPASTEYKASRDDMAKRIDGLLDALASPGEPHVCK